MKLPTELNLTTCRMMAAMPGGRASLKAMRSRLISTRALVAAEAKKQLDICDQHIQNMDIALAEADAKK